MTEDFIDLACPKCSRQVGHADDCPIDYKKLEPDGWEKPPCPLVGKDGNAYAIMGRVRNSLKRAGASKQYLEVVRSAMTAGDYNHLLRVADDVVEDVGEEERDYDAELEEWVKERAADD